MYQGYGGHDKLSSLHTGEDTEAEGAGVTSPDPWVALIVLSGHVSFLNSRRRPCFLTTSTGTSVLRPYLIRRIPFRVGRHSTPARRLRTPRAGIQGAGWGAGRGPAGLGREGADRPSGSDISDSRGISSFIVYTAYAPLYLDFHTRVVLRFPISVRPSSFWSSPVTMPRRAFGPGGRSRSSAVSFMDAARARVRRRLGALTATSGTRTCQGRADPWGRLEFRRRTPPRRGVVHPSFTQVYNWQSNQ